MSVPTEMEIILLERLNDLAELLQAGKATQQDRDEALGSVLKIFYRERVAGLVTLAEFTKFKSSVVLKHECEKKVQDCPYRKKLFGWPAAVTCITLIIGILGLVSAVIFH